MLDKPDDHGRLWTLASTHVAEAVRRNTLGRLFACEESGLPLPQFTIVEAATILRIPPRTLRRRVALAHVENVGTPAQPRYRWGDLLEATAEQQRRSA